MERYRITFLNARLLWDDLRIHIDQHFPVEERVDFGVWLLGYKTYFDSKAIGVVIMRRCTLEKLEALGRCSEKEDLSGQTARIRDETATFFEAYLNALYSLLQIVAKFTPYFYKQDSPKINIPDDFGKQVNFFWNENKDIDPEYSHYLSTKLWGWYEVFKDNRNAITHRAAIYITFGENGRVKFLKPPNEKERLEGISSWPTEPLERFVNQSFENLLEFLEFYVEHYRNRVPESDFTKRVRKRIME